MHKKFKRGQTAILVILLRLSCCASCSGFLIEQQQQWKLQQTHLYKLDQFPVTDTYSKIMNTHVMYSTNLKIHVLMQLAVKFQDRENQNFSFYNSSGGKFVNPSDVRLIPHLTAKCSAAINQAKQSRARCAKLLRTSP